VDMESGVVPVSPLQKGGRLTDPQLTLGASSCPTNATPIGV